MNPEDISPNRIKSLNTLEFSDIVFNFCPNSTTLNKSGVCSMHQFNYLLVKQKTNFSYRLYMYNSYEVIENL